jgi:2-(1,2-epoxy-1,2-dihydrophenyl)acetyl-CoA isomerase
MEPTIIVEKNNGIASLAFNRPHAMNTYNHQMGQELLAATDELLWDDTIRAVLLKGSGSVFMAGGDITFFKERQNEMPKGTIDLVRQLADSIQNLQNMNKIVLAAVHGAVAGAGISLMLAADLVIAHEHTKFTLAYSGIGTSPDGGASYFLPRLVGDKKAMELLLFSNRFNATDALRWGMINKISDESSFVKEIETWLQLLVNGPAVAFSKVKTLVHQSRHNSLAEQLELEGTCFAEATKTNDFKSGITAFLGKKMPVFEGK